VTATTGMTDIEMVRLVDEALRSQAGCETASVPAVRGLPNIREGRNWEIPNVILGDACMVTMTGARATRDGTARKRGVVRTTVRRRPSFSRASSTTPRTLRPGLRLVST